MFSASMPLPRSRRSLIISSESANPGIGEVLWMAAAALTTADDRRAGNVSKHVATPRGPRRRARFEHSTSVAVRRGCGVTS